MSAPSKPTAAPAYPAARFQSFRETARPDLTKTRLAALRAALSKAGCDGLLLPRADVFQGEYIPPSEDRLAFLTAFTGSAGFAIVLAEKAALFVDGRYTVQASQQVDASLITVVPIADTSPESWLAAEAQSGARIGYDPDLFTPRSLKRYRKALEGTEITLTALADPFPAIWPDRPAAPASKVVDHPLVYAGVSREDKLAALQAALKDAKLDALLVSECPNLNWLFNIRADDVPHLPILRAFALILATGNPVLFVDPARLDAQLAADLGAILTISAPESNDAAEVEASLRRLARPGLRIRLDEDSGACRFKSAIEAAGGSVDLGPDPILLMKAQKNPVEQQGARDAHLRDGVAMTRFLAWFDDAITNKPLTEIEVAVALEGFRIETGALKDIAFNTISAAGPHAALPHYRVSEASNRAIPPGLFLIDSGGQYRDGTTDITRTIAVGKMSRAMREGYTRVLKGMIALSMVVFPKGTSGAHLDAFARMPLWQAGQDFDHGTGHGVGSFLSVHEGPQRFSKLAHEPLKPGMILSNEPGYYREGAFGIRIENLVLVTPRAIKRGERAMFGLETLTLAPIDTRPIVKSLLTRAERNWLNAYHLRVREALSPHLDAATRLWLGNATASL